LTRLAAGDEQIYAQWVEQLVSHDVCVQVPTIWALQQADVAVAPVLVDELRQSASADGATVWM
jgi:hypothetical protein